MADSFFKRLINLKAFSLVLIFSSLAFLLTACLQKQNKVAETEYEPGLAVYYLEGSWRHIEKMPIPDKLMDAGEKGKPPITIINHRFGNGNVFDSGCSTGIGLLMRGFLSLPEPGQWQFKVLSNDGIEIYLNDVLIASDPEVHGDRFSEPMEFQAEREGKYPIQLRYFQRKGTASLKLYWKPPGTEDFAIIPEEAYWHIPKKK